MIISEKKVSICSAAETAEHMRGLFAKVQDVDRNKEHFWVIALNTKNVTQFVDLVSMGSMTAAIVHPRETFTAVVRRGGIASLLLAHNHPSGDTKPSQEDILLTRRLIQAGEVMGIPVLDHIIISGDENPYFSFRDNGLISGAAC